MQESSGKAAELEIAADQAEVFRRRTAHYDYRSLASVLDPIGPQAVADAQQGLARVLGKLQQTWAQDLPKYVNVVDKSLACHPPRTAQKRTRGNSEFGASRQGVVPPRKAAYNDLREKLMREKFGLGSPFLAGVVQGFGETRGTRS